MDKKITNEKQKETLLSKLGWIFLAFLTAILCTILIYISVSLVIKLILSIAVRL